MTLKIDNSEFDNPSYQNSREARSEIFHSEDIYDNEISICIVAVDRLDKTKLCIESVLKYTPQFYQLILIDNGSENPEVLKYFESVDFENKIVYRIERNLGANFAYYIMQKNLNSRYLVVLTNDCIVTTNWLDNLMTCMKSDSSIGVCAPVSSNISNFQQGNIGQYTDIETMQKLATKHNISDPKSWEERPRLISVCLLIKTEVFEQVGNYFDLGFFHDFSEDDFARRVHRAGYKLMLCTDTFVEHNHTITERNNENLANSIESGKKAFISKYGLDPWEDVNNYIFPYLKHMKDAETDKILRIFGEEIQTGTPFLDIKNQYKKLGFNGLYELYAHTKDPKYFQDLVAHGAKVNCDPYETFASIDSNTKFDFIVFGEDINTRMDWREILSDSILRLNSLGYLYFTLKNYESILSILEMTGNVNTNENSVVTVRINTIVQEFQSKVSNLYIDPEFYDPNTQNIIETKFPSQLKSIQNILIDENLYNNLKVNKYHILIQK